MNDDRRKRNRIGRSGRQFNAALPVVGLRYWCNELYVGLFKWDDEVLMVLFDIPSSFLY